MNAHPDISVRGQREEQRLPRWAPLIMGCALFMQGFDGSAITVALPAMARSLHTDPLRLNLAISAYLLGIAAFIPASAWVADRFGARRTFCGAIALFSFASLLCGLAPDLALLVAARILQGIGGALMIPVGRLVLLRSVERQALVRAIALFTVPALIAPVLGSPLGGLIVQLSSWHWIFLVNVPIGLIGIVATLRFIPDIRGVHPGPFDYTGFILLGIGLSGVIFALSGFAGALPGAVILTLAICGLASLLLYARHARNTAHPVLDHRLLAIRSFRIATVSGGLWRASMAGIPILTALLLQLGFGMGPLASGLIVFVGAAGALMMKVAAEPILRRFGFRHTLIANAMVTAALAGSFALFEAQTSHAVLIAVLFIAGFFRSLQYTSLGTLAYVDLPISAMARGSAFASMSQELAQSVGTSIAVLLIHIFMQISGALHPGANEIRFAFPVLALISLIAALGFTRLTDEDSANVRGSHARGREPRGNLPPVKDHGKDAVSQAGPDGPQRQPHLSGHNDVGIAEQRGGGACPAQLCSR